MHRHRCGLQAPGEAIHDEVKRSIGTANLGSWQISGDRPRRPPPTAIVQHMFVEVVEGPLSDWELVREKSRLLDDPPDGLLACIVTPVGDDAIHGVMVWETPGQRGDWAAAVMMPLFESGALAGVTSNPSPTTPVDVFLRAASEDA